MLKPYESWVDFAGHLKNEASIINFIAAYGTHALITGQTTLEGKRDAALTIITGASVGGLAVPADAVDFLNATGAYAGGTLGGLENVDLWIGGLAEEDHAVRRHARLDLQLRLRSADGEAAERRPLLLPAAARRPAPVRRDGEQLLRRDDHAQHRRDASAVGRVLDARPDPRGRTSSTTGSSTTSDGDGDARERRQPGTIRSAAS